MKTIAPKSNESQLTHAADKPEIPDSPRAFEAGAKRAGKQKIPASPRAFAAGAKPHEKALRLTLRAQICAGKNDSAEMYKDLVSSSLPSSAHSSPRSPLASPRPKVSSLSLQEAPDSSDEAFDFGHHDEATFNTGWNEWGITSDHEDADEDHAPKAKPGAKAAHPNSLKHSSVESEDLHWNEWGMTSDDEE